MAAAKNSMREQVRPGHDRVVRLLLDADDGVLLDQGQQPVGLGGHGHALLVDLRHAPLGRCRGQRAAPLRLGAGGGSAGTLGVLVSSLMALSVGLQRTADTSVLADAPEVDGQEDGRHQRHQDHVQDVEAQQRVLADLDAAQQQQLRWGC